MNKIFLFFLILIPINLLSSNFSEQKNPSFTAQKRLRPPAQVTNENKLIPSPQRTVHRETIFATPAPARLPNALLKSIGIQCDLGLNLKSPNGVLHFIQDLFSQNPKCTLLKVQCAKVGAIVQLILHRYEAQKTNLKSYEFGQGQSVKFEKENPNNVSIFQLLRPIKTDPTTNFLYFPENFDEELNKIIENSPLQIDMFLKQQLADIIQGKRTGTLIRTLNGLLQYFP